MVRRSSTRKQEHGARGQAPESLPETIDPISLAFHEGSARQVGPMVQAYCVKGKAKPEMNDAVPATLRNGKPAMKGTCPTSGTAIMRIGTSK